MTDTLSLTIGEALEPELLLPLELPSPPNLDYSFTSPDTAQEYLGKPVGGSAEEPIITQLWVNDMLVDASCSTCPVTLSDTYFLLIHTHDQVFASNFFLLIQEVINESLVKQSMVLRAEIELS